MFPRLFVRDRMHLIRIDFELDAPTRRSVPSLKINKNNSMLLRRNIFQPERLKNERKPI